MVSVSELIAQTSIFSALARPHQDQLAARLTRHDVPANTDIVRQGDPADALFLIEAGLVGVFVRDQRLGIVRSVGQLAPPESFGEMGLITQSPRTATCTTLEPTVVHRLGREVFDAFVAQVPSVSLGVARVLAERLQDITGANQVQWMSLSGRTPERRLWASVPEALIRKHRTLPIEMDRHFLTLGMVDPMDANAVQAVRQALTGVRFKIVAITAEDYERFVNAMSAAVAPPRMSAPGGPAGRVTDAGAASSEPRPTITFIDDEDSRSASRPEKAGISGQQVIAVVDEIVSAGLGMGASDIHIEHERKGVIVRYRVDGSLRTRPQMLGPELGKPLVSRLKLLAKLDITETRRPQDGRISLTTGKRVIDLRMSTMPAKFGEKVVLRVLDAEANVSDLKGLILFEPVRQLFSEMIFRPHGLVLVTGPTGSGKTTTMYSALYARRKPELNVLTVEDPIEYHLDGVTQIQVQSDVTSFASVLRAMLRQDPDVIMVGETRDRETARMAVEASTTGHLVLTSMHTNSALEAMYRLLDLGVERYAIANALVGVLHQRLVRKLCPNCSEVCEYPGPIMERLYRAGAFTPTDRPTLRRGAGCQRCGGSGFKGRVGVTELLVASDAVRNAFSAGADASQLRPVAGNGALCELPRSAGALLAMGATAPGEVLHLLQHVGDAV